MIEFIDDTDWFLPELYPFASNLGISSIKANYSRWVIDINRDPEQVPLYNDGRLITGLCTTTDFLGNPIYKEGRAPHKDEIERRKREYFLPYYQEVQSILDGMIEEFGYAILYDSHSIRSVVSAIQPNRFPDMILGTADGTSASQPIIDATLRVLRSDDYEVTYNTPFKGGNITRHFGKPALNQHALQLERCKDLYMQADEKELAPDKAGKMTSLLQKLFQELIDLKLP